MCMGLATGLTLSDVSVAGLLGIRESSSYSFGSGSGVCCRQNKLIMKPVNQCCNMFDINSRQTEFNIIPAKSDTEICLQMICLVDNVTIHIVRVEFIS